MPSQRNGKKQKIVSRDMKKQDLCIGDRMGTEGKNWSQGSVFIGIYSIQVPQTNTILLEGAIFLPMHL